MTTASRLGLAGRELTYGFQGATLLPDDWRASLPAGVQTYERITLVGHGLDAFQLSAQAVLGWEVKRRSGFVVAGDVPARQGARYWLTARLGPFRVQEPAEVVGVVETSSLVGFAYGTLTGHPVSGEEAFLVSRHDDGSVWFVLRSVTQPSTGSWRLAAPFVGLAQRVYRRRYLRALRPQPSVQGDSS